MEIERRCAQMRRETATGGAARERRYELKARILNTFLTLMNLRENLHRAALGQPIGGSEVR
jgi:hypothetical protein